MVTLRMTLGHTNPKSTPNSTFCIAFHIFVVGERRDLMGVQVVHSKSQPTDDKLSLKGAWSWLRDLFKFWEIIDNILEMVPDGDIVTLTGLISNEVQCMYTSMSFEWWDRWTDGSPTFNGGVEVPQQEGAYFWWGNQRVQLCRPNV